mmetsp:Transcript_20666/g.41335  ORF Transcript_20666/g.41335 Transcript_20666/m.41335 type:complete len:152 (-) Transcript_20666:96-551(-)
MTYFSSDQLEPIRLRVVGAKIFSDMKPTPYYIVKHRGCHHRDLSKIDYLSPCDEEEEEETKDGEPLGVWRVSWSDGCDDTDVEYNWLVKIAQDNLKEEQEGVALDFNLDLGPWISPIDDSYAASTDSIQLSLAMSLYFLHLLRLVKKSLIY